jgi:hypothetical protein
MTYTIISFQFLLSVPGLTQHGTDIPVDKLRYRAGWKIPDACRVVLGNHRASNKSPWNWPSASVLEFLLTVPCTPSFLALALALLLITYKVFHVHILGITNVRKPWNWLP